MREERMAAVARFIEVSSPKELTTLVQGATVALSSGRGEWHPDALLGVFYRDERIISALSITVDGVEPPLLESSRISPTSDRIALLAAFDEYRNGQALLVRRRTVTNGRIDETIELRSFSSARTVVVEINLEADASSILTLKSGELPEASLPWKLDVSGRKARVEHDGTTLVVVEVDSDSALFVDANSLRVRWTVELGAGGVWSAPWSIIAGVESVTSSHLLAIPLANLNVRADDHRWSRAVASASADLAALMIELPERGLRFIGAGAPWYQAIFGRDSLIAAWEALPLGTDLALDVLETLAQFQGTRADARTMQAPGKILHEHRLGRPQVFGMTTGETYYGSVDSSALFVMLLTEAYRWGAPVDRIRELLPAARLALTWCRTDATCPEGVDRGPFVWYTPDAKGLGNQGWKDSGDCLVHSDGSLATGSIAIAEAQAYVYEALRGMARLERDLGDRHNADTHQQDADNLAEAFAREFWVEAAGVLALALDGSGKPLLVATTNMGQCLWSGILSPELAELVTQRCTQADLLSPWGLRTLGSNEVAYNPLGYHLGTVWAHDTAIVAAGMARFGHGDQFRLLTDCLLDAAEKFGWRLPELYAGLNTTADGAPLPYPASCSPQAWSAGAPLLLLRSMLGLSPDVPAGTIRISPMLGTGERLKVDGIQVGGRAMSIECVGDLVVAVTQSGNLTIETH